MYKIPAKTLFLGKNIVFVPECHSTNTYLAEIGQKSEPMEGTVVITDHQTAGRGQRGNRWEAQQGMNLTFSLLLHPCLRATEQFSLTIMVSLAIRDYLKTKIQAQVNCKIKWPNDILLDQKKVCGILIENIITGQTIEQSIVGIGLNINQQSFPISTATSLALVTGRQYSLNDELHLLLSRLEARYLQLKGGHLVDQRKEYHSHLFGRGEERMFRSAGRNFRAVIEGVDESGKLMVRTGAHIKLYHLKEIEFL